MPKSFRQQMIAFPAKSRNSESAHTAGTNLVAESCPLQCHAVIGVAGSFNLASRVETH